MKMVPWAGVVAGIVMIGVGYFADQIGVGPNPGVGWKQIFLMIAGVLVVGVSLVLGKGSD